MTLDLLDTPLRISWELHAAGTPMPGAEVDRVVERLLEAGIFLLHLERRPLCHPRIGAVLQRLSLGGCQTTLVCDGSPAELAALQPSLALRQLFLNAGPWAAGGSLDGEGLRGVVAAVHQRGWKPALLLLPNRDNIPLIPELFALCQELGIGRIKLPNRPHDASLGAASGTELPGPQDLDRLALALGQAPLDPAAGVALEIHDLFLWELLQPVLGGERGEYGGCQAANSLGHIDARGELHPCSSWPQSLGSVLESSLESLWNSPLRHQLRAEIAAVPRGCIGCGDYPLCLGGCRGLARSLNQAAGARDLLCRGPRPPRS